MKDELKNIAPELSRLRPPKDVFKFPDDYFDAFDARVMDRLEAAGLKEQAPLKVVKKPAKRFTLPQFFMAAAAAFALVVAAVWFLKPNEPRELSTAKVELSEEDIEAYLLENVQYLESNQLAMLPEVIENEYQPPKVEQNVPQNNLNAEDITPEDVEQLLNDMTEEELEDIL